MKNTTKTMLLLGFLWVIAINPPQYDPKFFLTSFLFCILLSMYRFFILQNVVYEDDENTKTLIEFIKSRKEDSDE